MSQFCLLVLSSAGPYLERGRDHRIWKGGGSMGGQSIGEGRENCADSASVLADMMVFVDRQVVFAGVT